MNLQKYIKKYTDKNVKVVYVEYFHHAPNTGAIYSTYNNILKIRKSQANFRPLIWHEMGHIATDSKSHFSIKMK